ncbi:MAG: PQQ-binding-like beta-propeller repeat protein [Pirellulales bacterium]
MIQSNRLGIPRLLAWQLVVGLLVIPSIAPVVPPSMSGLMNLGGLRPAHADDWPQWLGPRRDGVWREAGVVREFPAGGPKVVWRAPIAGGYSGPAVAQGRVYVTDFVAPGERKNDPGARIELDGREQLHCLDAATGKSLWKYDYPCRYQISYPAGPRCTPTVAGGRVYTLGAQGHLACVDAQTGKLIWSRELAKDYKAEVPIWGYSSHLLVDGDLVYSMVGGEGSTIVAFHKDTGKEVWKSLNAKEQGYCPPSIIEAGGKRQLIVWDPQQIHGLDPATGKVHWSEKLEPQYGMSIQMPVKHRDFLFAGGIGNQALLLKLASDKPAVEVVWHGTNSTAVYPTCGAPFVDENGVLYGACQQGHFRGVDLASGKRLWETFKPTTGQRFASSGTCFIVRSGDRYFLMGESGDLIIAKLSAQGYDEVSRAHILEPTNEAFGRPVVWSHPAFAQRSMFMRNDKEIVRVSLANGE